jgi:hypothetical protein
MIMVAVLHEFALLLYSTISFTILIALQQQFDMMMMMMMMMIKSLLKPTSWAVGALSRVRDVFTTITYMFITFSCHRGV